MYKERSIKLEKEAAEHVAESDVWSYFGRNNSSPTLNTISCDCPLRGSTGHFAQASVVFEKAGLDLSSLKEIFRGSSFHNQMGIALPGSEYHQLGSCSAYDEEGWKKLAILAGKTIRFVHCHGSPEGHVRARYYPDGRVEVVDAYA